ncbi:hypothetical protein F2Q69_00056190 [Brassica cretica]|uniref:Uncharacterized protein n=1 Tax=Brassica cretica TaxID=69181 RepID=A0A8S9MSM7_BRACR|nr:hypothetical protein F2Q69_00056190 [Brassica cretica]
MSIRCVPSPSPIVAALPSGIYHLSRVVISYQVRNTTNVIKVEREKRQMELDPQSHHTITPIVNRPYKTTALLIQDLMSIRCVPSPSPIVAALPSGIYHLSRVVISYQVRNTTNVIKVEREKRQMELDPQSHHTITPIINVGHWRSGTCNRRVVQ